LVEDARQGEVHVQVGPLQRPAVERGGSSASFPPARSAIPVRFVPILPRVVPKPLSLQDLGPYYCATCHTRIPLGAWIDPKSSPPPTPPLIKELLGRSSSAGAVAPSRFHDPCLGDETSCQLGPAYLIIVPTTYSDRSRSPLLTTSLFYFILFLTPD